MVKSACNHKADYEDICIVRLHIANLMLEGNQMFTLLENEKNAQERMMAHTKKETSPPLKARPKQTCCCTARLSLMSLK